MLTSLKEQQALPESLARQAYILLEEMIVTLVLPPGASLSEAGLSARTGIGRTPIREALKKLEHQGLVSSLPRKGLMVRPMKVEDHLSLLEVLRPLDRLLAFKAARWATAAQRESLKDLAAAMVEAARKGDLSRYVQDDRLCDQIIYEAARNPFAVDLVTPLYSHSRRFMCCFYREGDLARSAEFHAELMHWVAAGDQERAAQASDALIDYLEIFTKAAIGIA
jgi:DNA-binding GntR family transcriptional regulator